MWTDGLGHHQSILLAECHIPFRLANIPYFTRYQLCKGQVVKKELDSRAQNIGTFQSTLQYKMHSKTRIHHSNVVELGTPQNKHQ